MLRTRAHLAQPVETTLTYSFGGRRAGEKVKIDRVACNGDQVTPEMLGIAGARQFVPFNWVDESARREILRLHRAALAG